MTFTFLKEKSTEEKVLVMDKTISRFSGKDNHKIVTDNLNPDVGTKEMQKELDKDKEKKTIPLFRFRSKYYELLLSYMNDVVSEARKIRNDNAEDFEPILNFLKINTIDDNKHFLDLAIMRNKNALASELKLLKFELFTCFYEKKLRVKYKIPEEETITIERYPEYHKERLNIEESFNKFIKLINDYHGSAGMDEVIFFNNISLTLEKSAGSEDFGYGGALVLQYHQQIDWTNDTRSEEAYNLFSEEFKKEQINVNTLGLEDEDDDEGGGDDSGSDNDFGSDDEGGDDDFGGDDEGEDDDFGGGDDDFGGGGDDDEGDDDDFGGGGGDDDDDDFEGGGDSKPKLEKGEHLFADINGKAKVSNELRELVTQIDRVLNAFEKIGLKNVVVNKLVELKELVKDALRIALVTNVEESLFRYSMYVKQFDLLVASLKETVDTNKTKEK